MDALTTAADIVVVTGGAASVVRATWRITRAIERMSEKIQDHEDRIVRLEHRRSSRRAGHAADV